MRQVYYYNEAAACVAKLHICLKGGKSMSGSKIIMILLAVLIFTGLFMLVACRSGCEAPYINNDESGIAGTTLVVYTTFSSNFAEPIIEMFEERYGVTVESHFAGTGATLARLRDEVYDPQADIMWGGGLFSLIPEVGLFEEFISVNEPYMMENQRNAEGSITRFTTSARLLMVNTDIVGDIVIRGYACLLNPALRGRIAIADPAAHASSFNHLVNQLYAMGGGDPHAGWDYVEQFIINVDGIILPDSAAVHHSVASGEFIVGLTYEEAPLRHIEAGANVEVVYIEEGIVATSTGVSIVAGAANRAAAEAFVNFATSYDVQVFIASNLFRRVARADVPSAGALVANADLNWIAADTSYILYHRYEWIEQFWDLWMAHR